MSDQENKFAYRSKDVVQVLCGIPIVACVAVFCANFVTTYSSM